MNLETIKNTTLLNFSIKLWSGDNEDCWTYFRKDGLWLEPWKNLFPTSKPHSSKNLRCIDFLLDHVDYFEEDLAERLEKFDRIQASYSGKLSPVRMKLHKEGVLFYGSYGMNNAIIHKVKSEEQGVLRKIRAIQRNNHPDILTQMNWKF